jgi:CRP-like cAMP-binding protein
MAEIVKIEDYLPQIKNVKLFGYLSDEELTKIMTISEVIRYQDGEKIVKQGDVSEYFFAVIQGSVKVSVRELNDDEVFICDIEQGEMFGEAAIFMAEKRTASVSSSGEIILLRIHRRDLMAFFKEQPQAGIKILMLIILSLLKKLRIANEELAFEKQSEIDFDYVDSLIQDFINETK